VGDNKDTAKVAARFGKPGGGYQLTVESWTAVMGDRPAGELWGSVVVADPECAEASHLAKAS
jgi:hypothetical protein